MARGGGRGGGEGAAGAADKHILFLTDGLPTTGDRMLKAELEQAKQLGVCIHSVFIGYQRFPWILHKLSCNTGGARFSAFFDTDQRSIRIAENTDVPPPDIEGYGAGRQGFGGGAATDPSGGSETTSDPQGLTIAERLRQRIGRQNLPRAVQSHVLAADISETNART